MHYLKISMLSAVMLLASCATGGERTAVQRALGQCAASVAGGALAGAAIGAIVGGDNSAGRGAVGGALAGAGVCSFLLYRASEQDKARIRELELAALNAEEVGTTVEIFTAENGTDQIRVETITAEVPESEIPSSVIFSEVGAPVRGDTTAETDTAATPTYDRCRYVTQNLAVQSDATGGDETQEGRRGLTCRTAGTGDWVTF